MPPSNWSLPTDGSNVPPFTNGKILIPQGPPVIVFQGIICNGGQVTDPTSATQPSGPCIPQAILDQVGKKQLIGFTSLAEGDGPNPPTFPNGSVFQFIPTLHSSSRLEDRIYLGEKFGPVRLRFTYPNGKLTVKVKQYDEANNLLLDGISIPDWAEVSGRENVFRICMRLNGTTNGENYINRVVIIGRLSADKKTISDLSYIMLVEGDDTSSYLLNGKSIRVFSGIASTSSQFRIAASEQPRSGGSLSLMSK